MFYQQGRKNNICQREVYFTQVSIYFFKNNEITRRVCEICSKLTIKLSEQRLKFQLLY